MIWDFSSLLMYAFSAIYFPSQHWFSCVPDVDMLYFHFHQFSVFISLRFPFWPMDSLAGCYLVSVFGKFTVIFLLLISSLIPWWLEYTLGMISTLLSWWCLCYIAQALVCFSRCAVGTCKECVSSSCWVECSINYN